MRRATLHRLIDCLALAGFVLVVSTGFLLRYVLPPGSGRLQGTGVGFGAMERPMTVLWGLTRQGWGDMHFWLSVGLMGVFALHLLLHWRWIRSNLRGGTRDASGIRVGLGIVGLLALVAVAVIPWLSPTTTVPRF
jgi:Domain of unknown function (DUF4405)